MKLSCVDDAIKTWRKLIIDITGIPGNKVLNGESIRSPELVTVKNGQKVPIGYDETCIVFYCDQIDDISVVSTENGCETVQSYELHLIIYGNCCKKIAQAIKSNLYSREILDVLTENGIGLLSIPYIENTSEYMVDQTYVLRNDIRIRFDCCFEDKKHMSYENVSEFSKDIIKEA
mgnify:CR=1 FL=1